jgi:hypothetical protein
MIVAVAGFLPRNFANERDPLNFNFQRDFMLIDAQDVDVDVRFDVRHFGQRRFPQQSVGFFESVVVVVVVGVVARRVSVALGLVHVAAGVNVIKTFLSCLSRIPLTSGFN